MNRVLQTYDDGSELTVKDMYVSIGIGLAATAAIVSVYAWFDSRAMKRRDRKYQSLEQQ